MIQSALYPYFMRYMNVDACRKLFTKNCILTLLCLAMIAFASFNVSAASSEDDWTNAEYFLVNDDLGSVYSYDVDATLDEVKETPISAFKFPFVPYDIIATNKNTPVFNEIANNNKIYNSLVICTNGSQDPICNNHWQDLNCTGCGSLSCEEPPDGNLNGSQAICPSTGNPPAYEWQFRNASNNWIWENASGVFWEDDYNPPSTSESTWYRRRTLCAGCTNWTETGEVVDVHVQPPLTSAGTINGDYCGTFPYTITTGQIQGMSSANLTQFIEFQWRRNCDGNGWETLTNLNFLDVNDNSLISYTVSNNAMIGNTTCLYQKRLRVHGCDDWVTTPNITISNPDGCCTFPDVASDSYTSCPGDNISGNVSSNDGSLTNPTYTLQNGGSASSNGSINVNSNGTFTFDPSGTPCGNYSFTYRVCNNNDSSCCSDATVSLNYTDTTDPVLSGIPGNVTVQCNSIPPAASPSASDNCDSNVSITMNQTTSNTICTDSYTITRTWTATDNCGNTDVESQVITVRDTTDPVLSGVPGNTTVSCNSIPSVASPSASDNCDSNVSITMNQTTSNTICTDSYTITRTWTATDNCGNTDVESQVITVRDTTDPVLSGVPGNVTVQCNAIPSAASPSASDNCDSNVSITMNQTTSNTICTDSYTITRTWTATDNCGNTDVESQVITVVDTTDPVLSGVPGNVTVGCDAVPGRANPTASDNCDSSVAITVNETTAAGACSDIYTVTRTWTATDNCGNADVETQVITVENTPTPTVTGDERCGSGVVNLSASSSSCVSCDQMRWYSALTGGSLVNTGATYAPSISTTTSYYVTCYNTTNDCESEPRQQVVGTINPLPTIVANANCASDGLTYSITVTTSNANALMSNQGTVTGSAPNFTISGITTGVNTVILAMNNVTSCDAMQMVTSPTCACPAGSPSVTGDERCGPGVVTLSATSGANCDEIRWYSAATGGAAINTGTTYAPSITATTSYFVACYNAANDCESDPRQEVIATMNPAPTFTTAMSQGTCNGTTANNDAVINLTSVVGDEANIMTGATYTPGADYGNATNTDVSGGTGSFAGLMHNTQYTLRVWNGSSDCFEDVTITTPSINCSASCTNPTYTATTAQGTCTGTTANNDATLNLSSVSNGDEANISAGSTYTGVAYGAAANTDVSGGTGSFTGLMHATAYTVRVWNGANDCFVDVTVTTPSINCTAIPCTPQGDYYTCESGPNDCNVVIDFDVVNIPQDATGAPVSPFVLNGLDDTGQFEVYVCYLVRTDAVPTSLTINGVTATTGCIAYGTDPCFETPFCVTLNTGDVTSLTVVGDGGVIDPDDLPGLYYQNKRCSTGATSPLSSVNPEQLLFPSAPGNAGIDDYCWTETLCLAGAGCATARDLNIETALFNVHQDDVCDRQYQITFTPDDGSGPFVFLETPPENNSLVDHTINVTAAATSVDIEICTWKPPLMATYNSDCRGVSVRWMNSTVTDNCTCTATCINPTATVAAVQGTCTGTTPNNDASINISSVVNGDEANYSVGASYTGPAYGGAGEINVSTGSGAITGLMHATQYTVRVFNGANDCFVDETIMTPSIDCTASCSILSMTQTGTIACVDGGTDDISSDDQATVMIMVTGTGTSSSYNLTISGGTTVTPTTGSYGSPLMVTLGSGTAGDGITYTITATDAADSSCSNTMTVISNGDTCSPVSPCDDPNCFTITPVKNN